MASISSASSVDAHNPTSSQNAEGKEKSKRPQLSCRNCRARKVKCDRVQPCSACSLHQIAHQCTYDLTEQERKPILQAEALRQKDKEIARLKNEVAARRGGHGFSEHPDLPGPKHRRIPQGLAPLQHYDGQYEDPEMATMHSMSVTQELADMTLRSKNPTGRFESFSGSRPCITTTYPFPTLWGANEGIACLYAALPQRDELDSYLACFERRAVGTAFPYAPKYCARKNVERFLAHLEQHAEQRPDILALIFAAIAQGAFYGAFDRHDGRVTQGMMSQELQKGNFFMAAAFHALRVSGFLSRPSLCTIETLSMLSQYLCDSGRFVDAWVLIGTTVRLAVLAKFHRNPVSANVEIMGEEQSHKSALWWWLLSLDATSAMVCGRPLGASTSGDCPPADLAGDGSSVHPLNSIRHQLTLLSRTILDQRRFSAGSIQSLTEQLSGLLQATSVYFPPTFSWMDLTAPSLMPPLDAQLASIHVLIHTLIILVNQQRQVTRLDFSDSAVNAVLEASRYILHIFKFVKQRAMSALQNWTLCQTAFNAAILLTRGIAHRAIHNDPLNTPDTQLVSETHNTFLWLHQTGIHGLAGAAAHGIHELWKDVEEHRAMPGDILSKDGIALIEGTDLQDTMLTGYDFASGDSDMSSPHEDRSPPGPSYPIMPISQDGKSSKRTRQGQVTPLVSSSRSGGKRTPRKDKESSKGRSGHGWAPGESHATSQGGRQWSVSKKQHTPSSSRLGSAPQKPRSRGTGAAASQYISSQHASQYLPNDVLNAFPNPPSGLMATDSSSAGWDELVASQVPAGQLQLPGGMSMACQSGTSATAGVLPAENQTIIISQPQAQQAATIAATQHVFTHNNQAYSQPQSPALWGFQFNPLPQQGLGPAQAETNQQGMGQEQQIMFPGGMADPRYFWDESDGTAGQFFWGG